MVYLLPHFPGGKSLVTVVSENSVHIEPVALAGFG